MEAVVHHYRMPLDKLCSRSRSRVISFPRQVAMYLARTETDASFPQIGAHLGNRDHTTILHGYEKISGLMETDERVRREVLQIKAMLYERYRLSWIRLNQAKDEAAPQSGLFFCSYWALGA
jgi:chromosomal replication initiator protein